MIGDFNNDYKIKEIERVFDSIILSKNIIKLMASIIIFQIFC